MKPKFALADLMKPPIAKYTQFANFNRNISGKLVGAFFFKATFPLFCKVSELTLQLEASCLCSETSYNGYDFKSRHAWTVSDAHINTVWVNSCM